MTGKLQIVFDCADPDHLARFWAAALGYRLADPPEGFASWQDALTEWGVPEEEWNSASAVVDPEGVGPRIYFQQVATPKPAKNRLHLDVSVGGGPEAPAAERDARIEAEAQRLEALGATRQRVGEQFGHRWIVMLDPEGNEFCVV